MKPKTNKVSIPTNIYLDENELEVVGFLPYIGKNIEFLQPSRIKDQRTPDVRIDSIAWEIKSPHGDGKQTLKRAYKIALKQSANVIFNLRHCKIPTLKAVTKLTNEFQAAKSAKRLVIITKAGKIIDIPKR